jgi:hypothetical protein
VVELEADHEKGVYWIDPASSAYYRRGHAKETILVTETRNVPRFCSLAFSLSNDSNDIPSCRTFLERCDSAGIATELFNLAREGSTSLEEGTIEFAKVRLQLMIAVSDGHVEEFRVRRERLDGTSLSHGVPDRGFGHPSFPLAPKIGDDQAGQFPPRELISVFIPRERIGEGTFLFEVQPQQGLG